MIHISMIPQEFVDKYNLKGKVHDGFISERLTKGMYGLPKAGQILHDALVTNLEPYGYHPPVKTPRKWTQGSRTINFTLVINYFGVKYSGKYHCLHLK